MNNLVDNGANISLFYGGVGFRLQNCKNPFSNILDTCLRSNTSLIA